MRLQMALGCLSWMPHFPKARSCLRDSFKFGKVLCPKNKVPASSENVSFASSLSLEGVALVRFSARVPLRDSARDPSVSFPRPFPLPGGGSRFV